ncbi:MAG: tetratricopeptide repeat protein [Candidatus Sumerlaeia bacterium]|nr:tetratricopeptide repeat protein [Candidatus Sumerlaeia bacterium]
MKNFQVLSMACSLFTTVMLVGACSLSGNLAQQARDQVDLNNHEHALALALEALDADPGNRTAQIVVDETRDKVRAERIARGEELASTHNDFEAIREWRCAIILSKELRQRNFQTRYDDLFTKITEIRERKGTELMEEGHRLFFRERYEDALKEYYQAIQLVSNENLPIQVGQCYYELGQSKISRNQYRHAIDDMKVAERFAPNLSDLQRILLASRFHLGRCYLEKNSLRLAALELEILADEAPNYRPEGEDTATVRQITDEVIDLATRRISITPFTAAEGVNPVLEGRNLPVIMQDTTFSHIDASKSSFIRLFRADTAAEAFRQIQESRMIEADSRTVRAFRFESADYVLGGTLLNAKLDNPEPRRTTERGTVRLPVWVDYYEDGRMKSRVDRYIDHPYNYTIVEDEISLFITVNASLTEVETNAQLASPTVPSDPKDSIKYAENLQMLNPPPNTRTSRDNAISRIPEEIRALFDERKELKSPSELLEKSQFTIADRVTSWVLQELDQTPERSSDPEPCYN